jgi:hypothetical protein
MLRAEEPRRCWDKCASGQEASVPTGIFPDEYLPVMYTDTRSPWDFESGWHCQLDVLTLFSLERQQAVFD